MKSMLLKDFDWRTDFELADELVWFISLEGIIWCSTAIYPVMAFVGVIIMYLHCRYLVLRLKYQKR